MGRGRKKQKDNEGRNGRKGKVERKWRRMRGKEEKIGEQRVLKWERKMGEIK